MDIGWQNNHDEYSCLLSHNAKCTVFPDIIIDAVNSLVLQILSRNCWLSGYEVVDFNAGSSHL